MPKFLPGTALLAAALAAGSLFATSAGAGEVQRRFTRDGETYAYTAARLGDRVVLTGTREANGAPFELVVRGDWVSGTIGGSAVSFRMPGAQAKLAPLTTEVAAR